MKKWDELNRARLIKALLETKHLKPDLRKIALEHDIQDQYQNLHIFWKQFKDNFIISIKLKDFKAQELFDQQKEIHEYNKEIEEKTEETFKKQDEVFIPKPNVAGLLHSWREKKKEISKEIPLEDPRDIEDQTD